MATPITTSAVNINSVNQFGIPCYTEIDYTYYGSTNNVKTATYKAFGTVVGVLNYTYVSSGAANNDLVLSVFRSA